MFSDINTFHLFAHTHLYIVKTYIRAIYIFILFALYDAINAQINFSRTNIITKNKMENREKLNFSRKNIRNKSTNENSPMNNNRVATRLTDYERIIYENGLTIPINEYKIHDRVAKAETGVFFFWTDVSSRQTRALVRFTDLGGNRSL